MSNTGERYHSDKAARAAALEHANQTGKPYAIHQAIPAGMAGGWYVLAELTWSPLTAGGDPEGTITYHNVGTVQPDPQPEFRAALRDQMGPDPDLFDDSDSEASTMPDELLVEIQHTRIEALERALKNSETELNELRRKIVDERLMAAAVESHKQDRIDELGRRLQDEHKQNQQRQKKLTQVANIANGLLKRD